MNLEIYIKIQYSEQNYLNKQKKIEINKIDLLYEDELKSKNIKQMEEL